MTGNEKKVNDNRRTVYRQWKSVLHALIIVVLVGLYMVIIYGLFGWNDNSVQPLKTALVTISLLLAFGFFIAGGFIGFLFGIPRIVDRVINENSDSGPILRANDNLEQISDWLTKIIVGVTLIELVRIPGFLKQFADFMGTYFTDAIAVQVFSVSIVIFFSLMGFLIGFLVTRLVLQRAFNYADRGLLEDRLDSVQEDVQNLRADISSFQQQIMHHGEEDNEALILVQGWLKPEVDFSGTGAKELQEAKENLISSIKSATPAVKAAVYHYAHSVRQGNWRYNPEMVERTIPIFQALVESNPNEFHNNYAQLGFAYKDKLPPDNEKAEDLLTTAIQLRNEKKVSGKEQYEANRATVRIRLERSDEEILQDLAVLAQNEEYWNQVIHTYEEIKIWLEAKQLDRTEIMSHDGDR